MSRTDQLLEKVRSGASDMTLREQIELPVLLAVPAILSQISTILMEYVDAAMVGHLGAEASASIGLVATTTWLFWGVMSASVTGFSVQVAHKIGASDSVGARTILRQAMTTGLSVGMLLAVVGASISWRLPYWLGGEESFATGATHYFLVFSLSLPLFVGTFMMSSMLRVSGNVKIPSLLNVNMCVLNVVFNYLFIFPTSQHTVFGHTLTVPGADLGVMGAALGTALAEAVTFCLFFYFLFFRSVHLRLFGRHRHEPTTWKSLIPTRPVLLKAFKIGSPIGMERIITTAAQITATMIVAPLGKMAIAANSLGVSAESLCYMPGYGIGDAATTLVGQSVGARRRDLAIRFAYITVVMGVSVMTLMGVVLYLGAPFMMGILSPVDEIVELGVSALRIEAFAEPLFAASIVCYGVFVGAGDTLIPSSINLATMWGIRITLAIILSPHLGLDGVWLAMCIELCIRGLLMLWRLRSMRWIPKELQSAAPLPA